MQEQQLRGILYQLQDQNKELLQMVMDLQIANYKLQEQLNQDFYKVYTEIHEPKNLDEVEAKELLKSKKFMMGELDHINAQNTEKAIAKFNENLMAMEENLENIIN